MDTFKILIALFLTSIFFNSYSYTYGERIFNGGFNNDITITDNSHYRVQIGDKINVQIWGDKNFSGDYFVDLKGNIFIPSIGPIYVNGLTSEKLNSVIQKKIFSLYSKAKSYSRIDTAQSIRVFVTGNVINPGVYKGYPNSGFLYFLSRSSGLKNGSYRDISIIRNGKNIATFDIYPILYKGKYPHFQIRNDDIIFVHKQHNIVSFVATKDEPESIIKYEVLEGETGEFLLKLVALDPKTKGFIIIDSKNNIKNLSLEDFKSYRLSNGDSITPIKETSSNKILVHVDGAVLGKVNFVVDKTSHIKDVLDSIEIEPQLADIKNIYIQRKSLKQQQQKAILDSVKRLKQSYYLANSSTPEEAKIRSEEAKLIEKFTSEALKAKPKGILVISDDNMINNVLLEDGDTIYIPRKKDTVSVVGEVISPTTTVFKDGKDAEYYIAQSGGYSSLANKNMLLIKRNNGAVSKYNGGNIVAGEQIIVLPNAPSKQLLYGSIITQMLYQIAIATAAVLKL